MAPDRVTDDCADAALYFDPLDAGSLATLLHGVLGARISWHQPPCEAVHHARVAPVERLLGPRLAQPRRRDERAVRGALAPRDQPHRIAAGVPVEAGERIYSHVRTSAERTESS